MIKFKLDIIHFKRETLIKDEATIICIKDILSQFQIT